MGLTAYVANTIDAQIIKDVPLIKSGITDSYKLYTHYVFPPYAQIDSLVEEGLRFISLEKLPTGGYWDEDNLRNPFFVLSFFEGAGGTGIHMQDSIIYWDTSMIGCQETQDFSNTKGDYYEIPSQMVHHGTTRYVIYYFVKEGSNNTPRCFRKFIIPNSMQRMLCSEELEPYGCGVYSMKYFSISPCTRLAYDCDTVVVGTSLQNLAPSCFADCKYIYFKAGIPFSHVKPNEYLIYYDAETHQYYPTYKFFKFPLKPSWFRIWNTDAHLFWRSWSEHMYENVPYAMPWAYKADEIHYNWKEVHVPRWFKEYYQTGVDSLDNLLIDDLPVVPCKKLNLFRKRYVWVPLAKGGATLTYFLENICEQTISLEVQDSLEIQVLCEPMDATVRYYAKMSSSDESVVSVDPQGFIYAQAEGQAVITAEALDGSGVTARFTINVSPITGINAPTTKNAPQHQGIYSLSGTRIKTPRTQLRRGAYIIDSKKVLIK